MEYFQVSDLKGVLSSIKDIMFDKKDYLVELDAQNGDGDLGISMSNGFSKTLEILKDNEEDDLGKFMLLVSKNFNEEAPSTLGTLLSMFFMGMAKELKGKTKANADEFTVAMEKGLNNIMSKGGAEPGEKTIIDSLYPGIEELKKGVKENKPVLELFQSATEKAQEGMLDTKNMKSVHGRAAYYGDKSIGIQDGGATVGMYIFKGITEYINILNE